jgi:RNA polymerase sigma-70 factor (ECF subfamily)
MAAGEAFSEENTDMVTVKTIADEQRLIASIMAGEAHLFHNLIHPYERLVYSVALSSLRNPHAAEDTAHEVFLTAFHRLAECPPEAGFSNWLVSLAIHKASQRSTEPASA